jgi:GMP synthase (glutamine-hydrolysing)
LRYLGVAYLRFRPRQQGAIDAVGNAKSARFFPKDYSIRSKRSATSLRTLVSNFNWRCNQLPGDCGRANPLRSRFERALGEIRMPSRRRSAVVLRHVAFEDLGLLEPVLHDAGWNPCYCEASTQDLDDPSIEQADLLIALGGPIGVYETDRFPFLLKEIALLERRLAKDRPTLGICLGGQLMAKALGSRVFPGPTKEIGWGRVELTNAGKASSLSPLAEAHAVVLHWHGDTFDLPDGAVRLASNAVYENQAFAYRGRAMALQFHVEVDPQRLDQWYVGHAVELSAANVSIPDLRAATAAVASQLRTQTTRIFDRWLQHIG